MNPTSERPPVVAGRLYPSDPQVLAAEVRRCVGSTPTDEPAIAIMAPHGGYAYSGAIAGEVYRSIRVPSVAIVLCPNHTGWGERTAIVTRGAWRIPGGRVPIDSLIAEELRGLALLTEDSIAHEHEHSLEVQLPFLLHRNPRLRIVPVCLSHLSLAVCARLGQALAETVAHHGRDVLLVVSTNMSHYLDVGTARTRDRQALDQIEALNAEGLYHTVFDHGISMCGVIPATAVLLAAHTLGARSARLVRYGHSGEASGDHSRVVGYAGVVIR